MHGDFHGNNVLLTPEGRAVVIDWSNLRIGDPRIELSWARLLLKARHFPDQGAGDLDLYERFSGKQITDIELFDALSAMKLILSTLLSIRFGAESQGMRAGGEQAMIANRPLFDYALDTLGSVTAQDMSALKAV